jgi:uncharacterized membrane protein YphA (DoxX/SURF4 family)
VLPWAGLAIRLAAAAIWLAAGATKLADLDAFRGEVGAYDVLPSSLVDAVAYALPLLELMLGLYLLAGLLLRQAAALSVVLLLVFVAAQAQAWARGLSIECGCFGGLDRDRVGLVTILRDVALSLPSIVLLVRPARSVSLDRRFLGRPDRFAGETR